ncbi:hypothetical protein [Luteolibacter soli]|uniref:Uncharacterized protein n=1 Tax=Luteolibacter soli TaxID=3135280 RepID=A0ABU9B095_9BACT
MKARLLTLAVACLCPACSTTTTEKLDPLTGKALERTVIQSFDGAAFTAGANAVTTTAAAVVAAKQPQIRAEK